MADGPQTSSIRTLEAHRRMGSSKCYCLLWTFPPDKEQSGGNGSERSDQAGLRIRAQAPSLHRRARPRDVAVREIAATERPFRGALGEFALASPPH